MTDAQPLLGRRVLVTPSSGGSSSGGGDLVDRLVKLGAEVLILRARDLIPPESLAPLDAALDRLREFGWLVFTSQNAIEPFFARLAARGMGLPELRHLRLAAIGTSTAEGLRQRGRAPDLVPPRHVSESLAAALGPLAAGSRVLLPRAQVAREALPERLLAAGAVEVCAVAVYRAVPAASDSGPVRRALEEGKVDAVAFASAGTVRAVLDLLGAQGASWLARCKLVCIGPVTAAACSEAGLVSILSDPSTNEGLVAALVGALSGPGHVGK
jgi:uroporphyrinogen III methyltransferase / synthase